MSENSTMTRAELVEVAEISIKLASKHRDHRTSYGPPPPEDLAEKVREVARTVGRVHWDWWDTSADCGCLVGTLNRREGRRETDVPSGLTGVSMYFINALRDVIPDDRADADWWEVIDG